MKKLTHSNTKTIYLKRHLNFTVKCQFLTENETGHTSFNQGSKLATIVLLQEFLYCSSRPLWMMMNRLKLNADKTQLIWLGIRQQLAKLTVSQLPLSTSVVEFASTAKDLGMVLDNPLSMESQVTAVCRSCFYQLRQVTTDFLVSTIPRSSLHPLPAGLLQRSTH